MQWYLKQIGNEFQAFRGEVNQGLRDGKNKDERSNLIDNLKENEF